MADFKLKISEFFNFYLDNTQDERIKKEKNISMGIRNYVIALIFGVDIIYKKFMLNFQLKNLTYELIIFLMMSIVLIFIAIFSRNKDERVEEKVIYYKAKVFEIFATIIFIHWSVISKFTMNIDNITVLVGTAIETIRNILKGIICLSNNKEMEKKFKTTFLINGFIVTVIFNKFIAYDEKIMMSKRIVISIIVIALFYFADTIIMKISNIVANRQIDN
jgi:hypothetical protein